MLILILLVILPHIGNSTKVEYETHGDTVFAGCIDGCKGRCPDAYFAVLCSHRCGRDALDRCIAECWTSFACDEECNRKFGKYEALLPSNQGAPTCP
ncbi:hypothetical protein CRM22_006194 [Opisthorchis felineus]|uniref:Uncharacterized protein n=1 Tax=Opisthorchis felineus TaxID=147828 RepID=A0A4S2LM84_OPIFE|nr:hypothetical protein CRM22_006194 [Opisthorchis felineus]